MGRVVAVDRGQLFDPANFLGPGWTVDEQDERSLALVKIDIAEIRLEHVADFHEDYIKGEERHKRLKTANHILLDAKIFQTLWENQKMIPKAWKRKSGGGTTFIFFDGTVLLSPDGHRHIFYLCWCGGRWSRDSCWLDYYLRARNFSAVLPDILEKDTPENAAAFSGGFHLKTPEF